MTKHLSQEDFILAYYRELDASAHLAECDTCRDELARLTRVLDNVTPVEVPEPDDEYEQRVWNRLSWRLRAEKKPSRNITRWLAVAALFAVAFIAGLLVNRRETTKPGVQPQIAQTTTTTTAVPTRTTEQTRDRILFVVVGDHFDSSERVLVELTNLTPEGNTDISSSRARAEELLASNRLYRRTAMDRGEDSVATLLDELEPVLMQIAHAPDDISSDELRRIQKRVESRGLVFKLRVVRADVRKTAVPHVPQQPTI
jgi:hypothetical protein